MKTTIKTFAHAFISVLLTLLLSHAALCSCHAPLLLRIVIHSSFKGSCLHVCHLTIPD